MPPRSLVRRFHPSTPTPTPKTFKTIPVDAKICTVFLGLFGGIISMFHAPDPNQHGWVKPTQHVVFHTLQAG
jgi:hypothetical protein